MYELTISNWGFCWHILLALAGTLLGSWIAIALIPINGLKGVMVYACIAGAVVFLIGLAYEFIEYDAEEFWQDLAGNFVGIFIGLVIFYLLARLLREVFTWQ